MSSHTTQYGQPPTEETGETGYVQPIRRKTLGRSLAEIALMLLIVWVVFSTALRYVGIADDNMAPTYNNGQQILASRLAYHFRPPKRGEVVVLQDPQNPGGQIMRRVVGLPGERIELIGSQVIVNGRALNEPYRIAAPIDFNEQRDPSKQIRLSLAQYYLMSDNRITGIDSRDWGPIAVDNILGRAWVVVFPLGAARFVEHATYE
jgi:signal peptidase I